MIILTKNKLKRVNNRLGHQIWDQMISQVGIQMRDQIWDQVGVQVWDLEESIMIYHIHDNFIQK